MQGPMNVDQHALLDLLSEFLMVKKMAVHLYRAVAGQTQDPEIRSHFETYGNQSRRHADTLVTLIQELQGDPAYVSPMARLAAARANQLLEVGLLVDGLTPEQIEWLAVQSVFLAESVDHCNWSTLQHLTRQIADDRLRQALERATSAVEPEEDEHLNWASETLARLTTRNLQTEPPTDWLNYLTTPEENIAAEHPAPIGGPLLIPPTR